MDKPKKSKGSLKMEGKKVSTKKGKTSDKGKRRRESATSTTIMADPRFAHIGSDKRFKPIPKLKKTIKIDERFEGMFKDAAFKTEFLTHETQDGEASNMELKRLYHTEEDERKMQEETKSSSKSEAQSRQNADEARFIVDYSRGEALMESSDEEEEDEEEETMMEDAEKQSGDIDVWRGGVDDGHEHVPVAEELTSRLAILNVDWDKISAADLFVLANSFKPPAGLIKTVTIYPSDFGLQRMESESTNGPSQFFSQEGDDDDEEGGATEEALQEKLRAYELDKLRYYYAVVACDTVATAAAIYEACDGLELEKSQNILDLRYIPVGEVFDNTPKDVASDVPSILDYKLDKLGQQALAHSKVKLSWEGDNEDDRLVLKKRKFNKGELEKMDYSNYLASDGESDFSEEEEEDDREARASKLKALSALCEDSSDEDDDDDDDDKNKQEELQDNREMTFTVGLKEKAESLLKARQEAIDERRMTVGEKLEKKKNEKKKARKLRIKELNSKKPSGGNDSDSDSGREGMDDPYFKQNLVEDDDINIEENNDSVKAAAVTLTTKQTKEIKQTGKPKRKHDDKDGDDDGKQVEDDTLHFDMNKLIKAHKNESKKTKKRNKKGKKGQSDVEHVDKFTLDTKDSRFEAIFDDKNYSIDPTLPEFKKTREMERLIKEGQQKRKSENTKSRTTGNTTPKEKEKHTDTTTKQSTPQSDEFNITALVAKVKKNASQRRAPHQRVR